MHYILFSFFYLNSYVVNNGMWPLSYWNAFFSVIGIYYKALSQNYDLFLDKTLSICSKGRGVIDGIRVRSYDLSRAC